MHHHHHRVCPPCPPVPPTPTITYRCSGTPDFTCGPVLDGTGFATLGECQANCAAPVDRLLGTAANFRVLASSTITNTGATTIDGNLGLTPGTAVTGSPTVIGGSFVGPANATAIQAQIDMFNAYNTVAAATPFTTIPTELGGTTLLPGVYNSADGTFGITGPLPLVLDAGGDPNAVWMFQMRSTLITAVSSTVVINGGLADNVFWQVGSSATLGATSTFVGNILALATISVGTDATIAGRALAHTAAVNLHANTVGP